MSPPSGASFYDQDCDNDFNMNYRLHVLLKVENQVGIGMTPARYGAFKAKMRAPRLWTRTLIMRS